MAREFTARRSGNRLRVLASATLVAGSVIGAWWFIESQKTTEVFLVTVDNIASGTPLELSQTQPTDLALFDLGDNYLRPGELLTGSYLVRPLAKGEAIPKSAVGNSGLDGWTNLVLTPSIQISSGIFPGSKVSVWAAAALDYQSYGEPTLLALDAEVIDVIEPEGNFQSQGKQVEIRVPTDSLTALIRSISNKDAIALTASARSMVD